MYRPQRRLQGAPSRSYVVNVASDWRSVSSLRSASKDARLSPLDSADEMPRAASSERDSRSRLFAHETVQAMASTRKSPVATDNRTRRSVLACVLAPLALMATLSSSKMSLNTWPMKHHCGTFFAPCACATTGACSGCCCWPMRKKPVASRDAPNPCASCERGATTAGAASFTNTGRTPEK